MINVSNEFRQLMQTRTDFKENAEITFADGTVLDLTENDFTISNNNIVDASDTNGIPLGIAVCRSIEIELMNDDNRFSEYDFFGARIRLYLTFQLSETVENIEYGTFTVLTPETYGTTVIITALDDMYKANKPYSTSLVFPATIKSMLVDACNTLDISLGTTSFLNDNFVVQSAPTDITFRQLFGYISMIAGGNARIDTTGRLRIITYDFSVLDEIRDDIINDDLTENNYHVLRNWRDLKLDTDDVVITGVQTSYTDSNNNEHTVIYGYEGYILQVENPLFAGQEQIAIDLIGNVMVGGHFRQFSGDYIAYPIIEFMDYVVLVDRKRNYYPSFVTDINFQFFGITTMKNSAEPTIRNSAKTYSDATKTLVAARKLVANERNAREQAVEQLAKDLQNSSGLYMTEDVQPDGSAIYYMHNKPTLSESMIVWKLTALAFAISNDGGNTYPYGFTVDGTTITRLLYAEGIDADYINTGAIRINDKNGNTMFLADYDTKEVVVNADKVLIGSQTVKSYVDTVSNELQNQIDGNITTYNLNYVPTLTNYPAWDWTYNIPCNNTVQLRDDLQFEYKDEYWRKNARSVVFNTETFVSYRFLEQNGVWGWIEIADSEYSYVLQQISELKLSDESITASVQTLETEIIKDYITKIAAQSLVTQTSESIRSDVSKTYETKSNASEQYNALNSSITQTAESITSEVTRAKNAEESLSSRITQTADKIELKVSKGDVSSQLSVESGQVTLKSNRFVLESTNCSISKEGNIKAKNVDLTGKITSSSGNIGGFTIGTSALYTASASALGGVGVHAGTDGFSVNGILGSIILKSDGSAAFETYDGVKIYSSASNYTYIKPNGITIKNSSYTDIIYSEKQIECHSSFTITGYNGVSINGGSLTYAEFESTTSYVYGGNTGLSLGKSGKNLGFFGGTGSTKKTVANITSPSTATASSIATKLNDLLTALRAYNLIG